MGIRFRRSVKIGKGVKINFGKTGASVSVGTKGFHHTIHTSGKRTTSAGIPGTGLSYVKTTGGGKKMAANKANKTNTSAKNKKIWLWVLGWIIIFPIPLTILVLRSSKLKKSVKIGIIAIAWLIFLAIAASGGSGNKEVAGDISNTTASTAEESSGNIKELAFSSNKDVTAKVGKSTSGGYLKVTVKSQNEFNPDDIVFVSENPEIAEIKLNHEALTSYLYFDIIGVDGGETNVYAMTKDGSVKSGLIHIIVPAPIKVESIDVQDVNANLVVGETTSAKVTVSPSNAEDKTVMWGSSDEQVATVDNKGNITAVGGGTAIITATSSNGISTSVEVAVDGTKTLMQLSVKHSKVNDVNIGDEWSYKIEINGERVSRTIGIGAGEILSFYAQFTESDKNPDVGSASTTYTVTEDDIANGFEVTMDLYVTENGGQNSGKSAHFVVTYTFSPNN